MIPNGVIFLSAGWVLGHLLILVVLRGEKYRKPILFLAIALLLSAYFFKPYTYDLNKYSIYFVTGYIPSFHWHEPHGGFQLDEQNTTGDPYTKDSGGYELGFRWLSKAGNFLLPAGSLTPRYDATYWDFEERAPPRHDAMVLLIMIVGAIGLIYPIRGLLRKSNVARDEPPESLFLVLLVVLGSVFYFVGSQNAIRQFLGLVIILLAVRAMVSRGYLASLILILVATMFHRWSLIFGFIAVGAVMGLSLELRRWPGREIHPLRVTRVEVLSLFSGIAVFILIKGLSILGVFIVDFPLIEDLKAYVIYQEQYQTFERPSLWIKVIAIISLALVSEIVLGRTTISGEFDIRSLRRAILFFTTPLILFPEIYARILSVYWLTELIFVIWALSSNIRRQRIAGVVVFLAYGVAPNVINILLGPQFLRSL